jgi:peptide/nickel transport system substrate-binding protein
LSTNAPRWRNEEYDRTFDAAQIELDPVKRAALLIRCNDLLVQGGAVIPVASTRAGGISAPPVSPTGTGKRSTG